MTVRPSSTPRPRLAGLVALLIALFATACDSQGRSATIESQVAQKDAAFVAAAPPPAPQESRAATSSGAPGGASGTTTVVPVERKVIRNGTIRLEVPNTDRAVEAVKALVASMGGHVSGEQRDTDEATGRQAVLTCRVPAERLDETIAKLRDVGTQKQVNLNAEDITDQYVDLAARLRTQQQLEERLRALLERPSNKLGDLLDVEREIARVRGEIDSMEGRKRVWDSQVALSTLTVDLREPLPVVAGEAGGVWATLKRAIGQAADNFVHTIAGLIAAIGVIVPIGVVVGLAFWGLRWLWRRGRAHRTAA